MATQAASTARVSSVPRPRRLFYTSAAAIAALIIFVGFSRSYYLKELFGTPALPWFLHLHGIVMSSWLVLLFVQSALVAKHRTDIHRRLGVLGGALAVSMVVIAVFVAIWAARSGHAPPGIPPLPFLTIPLGDMLVFGTMIGAAFYYRRRPELHKRLIVVGTIAILPAGIARWPVELAKFGPLFFFGVADALLLLCVAIDYAKTRKLNPAYLSGGLILIASHPLRLMLAGTGAWMTFAHWITRT